MNWLWNSIDYFLSMGQFSIKFINFNFPFDVLFRLIFKVKEWILFVCRVYFFTQFLSYFVKVTFIFFNELWQLIKCYDAFLVQIITVTFNLWFFYWKLYFFEIDIFKSNWLLPLNLSIWVFYVLNELPSLSLWTLKFYVNY